MNRETLINDVASKTQASKRRVSTILNAFLAEVTESLAREERVEIRQFGSFEVKIRKARMARDLFSNSDMPLNERPMPHFIPFDNLKKTVSKQSVNSEISKKKIVGVIEVNEREESNERSKNIAAMLSRAEILANKDLYNQAIKQYKRILEITPGHIAAISQLGKMFFEIGSLDVALQYYDQALQNDPSHIDALVNRAVLLAELGQYEEAKENLLSALEYDPLSYPASYELGVLYITVGSYDLAIEVLIRALETGQSGPEVYLQLGKAYSHVERHDEAIENFETRLSLEPDCEQSYRHLGMIYDKIKKVDRALEMYRKSNEINLT